MDQSRKIRYKPLFEDICDPNKSWKSNDSIVVSAKQTINTTKDLVDELQHHPFVPRNKNNFYLRIKVGNTWVEEQNVSRLPSGDLEVEFISLQYLYELKGPWGTEFLEMSRPHPSRPIMCCCCKMM